MKLKDRVAIITGGSRGIGKAIAKAYLKEGVKIAIAARSALELKATTQELKELKTNGIIGIKTDVVDIRQVKNLIRQTLDVYGTVDILVTAAGVQSPIGPLMEIDDSEWINNIHINLIGTMLCCKYVLPIMISKRKGKIINFSGGGATFPRPNFSAYACSKAAIVRFTETLAMEVRDYGIDVNAIAPGQVSTRMVREIIEAGNKAGKKELSEAMKVSEKDATPPELVAELALFLASEKSDGLNGRLISAVWDDWKNLDQHISELTNSSLYTLRRIDGKNFIEIKL